MTIWQGLNNILDLRLNPFHQGSGMILREVSQDLHPAWQDLILKEPGGPMSRIRGEKKQTKVAALFLLDHLYKVLRFFNVKDFTYVSR